MEQPPEQVIVRLFLQLVIEGRLAGKAWHKIMHQLGEAARTDPAFQSLNPRPYIQRLERLDLNAIGTQLYDFSMPPIPAMRADWREERRGWRDAFSHVLALGAFGEIRRIPWNDVVKRVQALCAEAIPERDSPAFTGYMKAIALLEWLHVMETGFPAAIVRLASMREQLLRIPMRALTFDQTQAERLLGSDLDGILAHIYARRD